MKSQRTQNSQRYIKSEETWKTDIIWHQALLRFIIRQWVTHKIIDKLSNGTE